MNGVALSQYMDRELPSGKLYSYKGAYVALSYVCNTDVCQYCYARSQKIPGCLSLDDFDKVVAWLADVGEIRHIHLVGGEPTLLPDLPDYLAILAARGFKTTIYTNGYFDTEQKGFLFSHPVVTEIVFHYEPEFFRRFPNYRAILFRNLERLHGNKKMTIIYCIPKIDFPYHEVLDIARRFAMELRWIFATPVSGCASYMSLDEMKMAGPRLQRFLLEAKQHGVATQPDLCVPLCIFEKIFLDQYTEEFRLVKFCFPFVYIKPNLQTQFCSSMPAFHGGRLRTADDLRKVIVGYRTKRQELNEIDAFSVCKECDLNARSCQGGCLTYRVYKRTARLFSSSFQFPERWVVKQMPSESTIGTSGHLCPELSTAISRAVKRPTASPRFHTGPLCWRRDWQRRGLSANWLT